MTQSVISLFWQILWIASGALALMLLGIFIGVHHLPKIKPGISGHRKKEETSKEHEEIQPDSYIDSFANDIE